MLFLQVLVFGQSVHMERAIFTTGGNFSAPGNYVTVYDYVPGVPLATPFDSALGDFSNSVITDGLYAYAHIGRANGSDVVYKYDMVTQTRVDSAVTDMGGTQNLLIWNDYLIVNRGFGAFSNFVRVFDKNDLSQVIFEDATLTGTTSGMTILDDIAYVSYTENDSGKLAAFDLTQGGSMQASIIPLDTLANGIGDLTHSGGIIYGLSQRFGRYNGLVQYDPVMQTFQSDTNFNGGGSFYWSHGDEIGGSFGGGVNVLTPSTGTVTNQFVAFPTAATLDTLNQLIFMQETDYFSYGVFQVRDLTGAIIVEDSVDVSGTAVALLYNQVPVASDTLIRSGMISQPNPISVASLLQPVDEGDSLSVTNLTVIGTGTANLNADEIIAQNNTMAGQDTILFQVCDRLNRCTDHVILMEYLSVGLSEDPTGVSMTMYPNPASNWFRIESTHPEHIQSVSIWDLSGREVRSWTQVQDAFDMSNVPTGVYVVRVQTANETWSSKLMKR